MNLGVDESNHGRFPEIFVCSYSCTPKDVEEGCFPKQRRKTKRSFKNIPYYHTIFTEDLALDIGMKNFPILAFCEFVTTVGKKHALERVFIDGDPHGAQLEAMVRFLSMYSPRTKLCYGPELDMKYRLVNEADNRANHLYRYYSKKDLLIKSDYNDTLLSPCIEDFEEYLL